MCSNIPLNFLHGGLALNFTNDMIGYFQDITFGVGYGYQMDLAGGTLGLGLVLHAEYSTGYSKKSFVW